MTKDEAITTLRNVAWLGTDKKVGQVEEALQMAITALEADNVVERITYMSQLNGGANYFDAFTALQTALQTNGDCISRQAIFDTVTEYEKQLCEILGDENELVETVKILKHRLLIELPSIQPEPSTDIQDVLEYLDAVLHPLVSPDNWNVYCELHDMISRLPSVQPDNSCDGCRYENADDGVLVPCSFCKRSHSDNYERRSDDEE